MYNYVNSMEITSKQRIAILGKEYKLKDSQQEVLYNYISNLKTSTTEKIEIFKQYSKNFEVMKDNTIRYK